MTAAILAASVPDPAAGAEVTGSAETAGRFRIYLGVAPGAGKTVAMLGEGHRQQQQGGDVVVGFVECHGRLVTEARAAGLENVPRKVVEYRGGRFEEMDLDAVLRRHPQVALVDELAHTNLPGSGRSRQALGRCPGAAGRRHRHRRDRQYPAPGERGGHSRAHHPRAGPRTGPGPGRAPGRPDRARRLLARAAPPPDAARQRVPGRSGPRRPRPFLPPGQPDRPAGASAALPRR